MGPDIPNEHWEVVEVEGSKTREFYDSGEGLIIHDWGFRQKSY